MSKMRPTIICYTTMETKDKAKAVAEYRRRNVSRLVEDLLLDAHAEMEIEQRHARPSLI